MRDPSPSLRDDLLTGAAQIADYIGRPRWWVYYMQDELPITRIGQTLISRKSELDHRFSAAVSNSRT